MSFCIFTILQETGNETIRHNQSLVLHSVYFSPFLYILSLSSGETERAYYLPPLLTCVYDGRAVIYAHAVFLPVLGRFVMSKPTAIKK